MRPIARALLILLLASCGGATPAPAQPAPPIWILAPHPDDEALFGAEPIARALRERRPVRVLVMTNGDLGCERDGWLRQRETVAAMLALGVPEDRIVFLGYPDGYLDALGTVELPPRERRGPDGSCAPGNTTYGARGEHGTDLHTALTGRAGVYTAASALSDLAAMLERDRPSDVYTAHPIDGHPDHATTYVLLRRALERAHLDRLPRIHRALVHVGGCWPNGSERTEPCPPIDAALFASPFPALPEPLAAYAPTERLTVADSARARAAIAEYHSQLHTSADTDWLGTFARADAVYWVETLSRSEDRIVRERAATEAGEARALAPPHTEPDPDDPTGMRATISIVQRVPLRFAFDARIPEEGSVRVQVLAREPDDGYALTLEGGRTVEIRRGDRVLSIHVPDDGARNRTHRWELSLDPRPDDGGCLELEVRRDGALLGIAVDPQPITEGDLVLVRARGETELGSIDASPR